MAGRTDPRDYQEHYAICRTAESEEGLRPIPYLPRERPIPALAMDHGYEHIAFTRDGLMKLVEVKPVFEPFEPKN
jgi:hypothetical protein